MTTLKMRPISEILGTFKIPATLELVEKRMTTNCNYFFVNYASLFVIALIISQVAHKLLAFFTMLLIIGHSILKIRTIKSKAALLWQKHKPK